MEEKEKEFLMYVEEKIFITLNKNPSQQDVDKEKSTFKTALEDRKKLIEGDLATVRGSVGKQLGLKSDQSAGDGNYDYVPGQGLVRKQ